MKEVRIDLMEYTNASKAEQELTNGGRRGENREREIRSISRETEETNCEKTQQNFNLSLVCHVHNAMIIESCVREFTHFDKTGIQPRSIRCCATIIPFYFYYFRQFLPLPPQHVFSLFFSFFVSSFVLHILGVSFVYSISRSRSHTFLSVFDTMWFSVCRLVARYRRFFCCYICPEKRIITVDGHITTIFLVDRVRLCACALRLMRK